MLFFSGYSNKSDPESDSNQLNDANDSFAKRTRYTNTRNDISKWSDVEIQCVDNLPVDIDGLFQFRVSCNRQTMMNVTKEKSGRRVLEKDFMASGVSHIAMDRRCVPMTIAHF